MMRKYDTNAGLFGTRMRMSIACSLLIMLIMLAVSPPAEGQNRIDLEFGVRAGLPFTVPFESNLTGPAATFTSQAFSRPPVSAGPTFAAVFHDRLAIQFDALYRRTTFDSSFFNGTSFVSSSRQLSSWEFPLIADYTILEGPLRPFGGGGILLGDTYSGRFLSQSPAFVINGGLEWRMPRLVIRPELRYTRWDGVSQSTSVARRENQFEYLIGFSFRALKR